MEIEAEKPRDVGLFKKSDWLALIAAVLVVFLPDFLGININTIKNDGGAANTAGQLAWSPFEIISPNGGERWSFGSVQEIKWQGKKNMVGANIYLVDEFGQQLLRVLSTGSENDGAEEWLIDVPPGSYKLQMNLCPNCTEGSSWDISDGSFIVVADEDATIPYPQFSTNESLVFFSPSGGEFYQPGGNMNIKWFGGQANWQLTFTLLPVFQSDTRPFIVAEGVVNDGNFEWPIPSSFTNGDYFLKMECSNCEPETFGTLAISFNYLTIEKSTK
jgi:hypothetical protein